MTKTEALALEKGDIIGGSGSNLAFIKGVTSEGKPYGLIFRDGRFQSVTFTLARLQWFSKVGTLQEFVDGLMGEDFLRIYYRQLGKETE